MIYKSILISTLYFIEFDMYSTGKLLKKLHPHIDIAEFPPKFRCACFGKFQAGEIGPNSPRDVVWICIDIYLSMYT